MVDVRVLKAFFVIFVWQALQPVLANQSDIPDEKWGYVKVRDNAFMFWWLYGAQVPQRERINKPLVLWLQGGPGGSGTGYGNFVEIGPLNVGLEPRNTTWLKEVNLLFVDNPVGCGFSYVNIQQAFTKNISEITIDLMKFIKSFLKEIPVFQSVPLYTIGESYGGKMIANFAVSLHEAVKSGDIECQLRGVGLGDSLISFPETVESYGPLYYSFSLLDRVGLEKINNLSKESAAEARKGNYNRSMEINDKGAELLAELTDNVDVYNILRHHAADQSNSMFSERQKVDRVYRQFVARLYEDPLSELMNGPIRKKLGIIPMNVTWGGQSRAVFEHQFGDLASAVLSDVSKLINYGLKVTIYEGQLDGICGTAGAEAWVRKLQWRGLVEFESSLRKPLYTPAGVKSKQTAAFVKSYQNVEFYYILKAGHMVPVDAPEMALEMLKRIIV